jgi:hypothetical protein
MNVHRVSVLCAAVVASMGAAVYADEAVSLKCKMAKGDKVIYRTKMEMKQTQNIAGMAFDNEMNNEAISSYTVDEIDEQGNYHLTIKAERLKVKAKFGALGGDYVFDSQSSERDKSSMIGAAVTPLYERMSGIVYQAKIGPDGDVLEVKGYAEQLKDILDANPLARQFGGGGGSNDAAKESLREQFVKLPTKAINTGDTWDVSSVIELPQLGKNRGKSTYRYVGPDKVQGRDTAKAEVTGETSFELNIDQDGAKVTGTLSSTSISGTIHFDLATGRVLRAEGSATLGGDLTVDANGMIIPIRNDQTMKSSLEVLEKLPD